jgi:hypothetical protein
VRALFAAVQFRVALGTGSLKVDVGGQGGGTVEAAGGGDMLNQARQARACDINGRAGALLFGTVIAERTFVAIQIHVPVLPVLAIVVHGEECSVNEGRENVY